MHAMAGYVPWYMSMTMGNVVRTRREVFRQIIESLVKLHTLDIDWKVVWLDDGYSPECEEEA